MYIAEGTTGAPTAGSSAATTSQTATPASGCSDLTSAEPGRPEVRDVQHTAPGSAGTTTSSTRRKGSPDIVYVGGSYSYNETGNDLERPRGRALAGRRADVARHDDGRDGLPAPQRSAPRPALPRHEPVEPAPVLRIERRRDHAHRAATTPTRRSSATPRGITGTTLARCQQLLSSVPTQLESLNKGYPTLQFQSLSVSPFNSNLLQGGTQDNGTWQTQGNPSKWENTMIGDGGQSGFDAKDPSFRFHTFFDAQPDVNFSGGAMADWNWIGDPFFIAPGAQEPRSFYIPDHQRSGRDRLDVRRPRPRVAHEDPRHGGDDRRRAPPALQRVDRGLRGPVR